MIRPEREWFMRSGRKSCITYTTYTTYITHFLSAHNGQCRFSLSSSRSCTTVSAGDVVEESPSGQVQEESIASRAQSPGNEAGLPQPVTDFFGRVQQPLAALLLDAIDFSGHLPDQNLVLALVAKGERRTDGEHSEVVKAIGELTIRERCQQRDNLCLKLWSTNNASSQCGCNCVRFRRQH